MTLRAFTISESNIRNYILIPSYYNDSTQIEANNLKSSHNIFLLGSLIDNGVVSVSSGVEIGKSAYGTGDIPFVRTSDITNWEIKTIPKQGVSLAEYEKFADKCSTMSGDILLVKDGSYLIGSNCVVSELDTPMLLQSHILRFRAEKPEIVHPYLLFLSLNSPFVQSQIQNVRFTSDIIDTIGTRYREIQIPIPKNKAKVNKIIINFGKILNERVRTKVLIRQFPTLMESALIEGTMEPFIEFLKLTTDGIKQILVQDTITLEYGKATFTALPESTLSSGILIPRYYAPDIKEELAKLATNCDFATVRELVEARVLKIDTGDEINKSSYGTGDIPFIRTSDFSNWELKHDPKHCISNKIYQQFSIKQDIAANDILMVRDGTYLIGTSCMITELETKMLYCAGIFKIRSLNYDILNPYLLLGLLNSYIVKRQIRSKQFSRDVIDTIGNRIYEIFLPIPKAKSVVKDLTKKIRSLIEARFNSKIKIIELINETVGNSDRS